MFAAHQRTRPLTIYCHYIYTQFKIFKKLLKKLKLMNKHNHIRAEGVLVQCERICWKKTLSTK